MFMDNNCLSVYNWKVFTAKSNVFKSNVIQIPLADVMHDKPECLYLISIHCLVRCFKSSGKLFPSLIHGHNKLKCL
jgi:hypothetical protein